MGTTSVGFATILRFSSILSLKTRGILSMGSWTHSSPPRSIGIATTWIDTQSGMTSLRPTSSRSIARQQDSSVSVCLTRNISTQSRSGTEVSGLSSVFFRYLLKSSLKSLVNLSGCPASSKYRSTMEITISVKSSCFTMGMSRPEAFDTAWLMVSPPRS